MDAQLLALPDDAVQLLIGEVELAAVLRRPAAGAVQVAGGGGVDEHRPGDVAIVLLLKRFVDVGFQEGAVDGEIFKHRPARAVVHVIPQAHHKSVPVVAGVGEPFLDALDRAVDAAAGGHELLNQRDHLRQPRVGILVDIIVHLFETRGLQCRLDLHEFHPFHLSVLRFSLSQAMRPLYPADFFHIACVLLLNYKCPSVAAIPARHNHWRAAFRAVLKRSVDIEGKGGRLHESRCRRSRRSRGCGGRHRSRRHQEAQGLSAAHRPEIIE